MGTCTCIKCLEPPKSNNSKENLSLKNEEAILEIDDWREIKELHPKGRVTHEKHNPAPKRIITLAQLESSGGSSYRPRNRKLKKRKEKKIRKSLFCAQLEVDSNEENSFISNEDGSSNIKSDKSSSKNIPIEKEYINQKFINDPIKQEQELNKENNINSNLIISQTNQQQNFRNNIGDFRPNLMSPFCTPPNFPNNYLMPTNGFAMPQLINRSSMNMRPFFISSPLIFNSNYRVPPILMPRSIDFVPKFANRVLFNPMIPPNNQNSGSGNRNNNQNIDQNYMPVPLQVPEVLNQNRENIVYKMMPYPEEKKSNDS